MKTLLSTVLVSSLVLVAGCATNEPFSSVPLYNRYSVQDIVKWSNDKVPPDEIIARLQRANGFYPLTAGEILLLRDEGVPVPVLDYMHQTHLRLVAREERFGFGMGRRDY